MDCALNSNPSPNPSSSPFPFLSYDSSRLRFSVSRDPNVYAVLLDLLLNDTLFIPAFVDPHAVVAELELLGAPPHLITQARALTAGTVRPFASSLTRSALDERAPASMRSAWIEEQRHVLLPRPEPLESPPLDSDDDDSKNGAKGSSDSKEGGEDEVLKEGRSSGEDDDGGIGPPDAKKRRGREGSGSEDTISPVPIQAVASDLVGRSESNDSNSDEQNPMSSIVDQQAESIRNEVEEGQDGEGEEEVELENLEEVEEHMEESEELLEEKSSKEGRGERVERVLAQATVPMPKRPLNAFNLFASQKRVELKDVMPASDLKSTNKYIGALWKELSEEQREQYRRAAFETNKEFAARMMHLDNARSGSSGSGAASGVAGSFSTTSSAQPPVRIKTVKPNSYNEFLAARTPQVKAQFPDMDFRDIMKMLSEEWRTLSDVQKEEFRQRSFEKARHRRVRRIEVANRKRSGQQQTSSIPFAHGSLTHAMQLSSASQPVSAGPSHPSMFYSTPGSFVDRSAAGLMFSASFASVANPHNHAHNPSIMPDYLIQTGSMGMGVNPHMMQYFPSSSSSQLAQGPQSLPAQHSQSQPQQQMPMVLMPSLGSWPASAVPVGAASTGNIPARPKAPLELPDGSSSFSIPAFEDYFSFPVSFPASSSSGTPASFFSTPDSGATGQAPMSMSVSTSNSSTNSSSSSSSLAVSSWPVFPQLDGQFTNSTLGNYHPTHLYHHFPPPPPPPPPPHSSQ